MRGVQWLVTEQEVGESLLRRPLLEALELRILDILAAAAERHERTIDMSALVAAGTESVGDGRIARIIEGVYHTDEGADGADLDDNVGWLDLGNEDDVDKKVVHSEKLDEVCAHNVPRDSLKSLNALLSEVGDVFKLKLDAGEHTNAEPRRIHLKQDAIPFTTG